MHKNQKGRFIVEMLVILALLAIFSPMIYTAQLEKQQKEVNLNNANQIIEIANSLRIYIQNNLDKIVDTDGSVIDDITYNKITSGFTSDTIAIPFNNPGIAKYLPPGLNSEATFKNRLFSTYRIGLNRRKVGDDIIVSGMVIAIPKSDISFSRTNDIVSMLGASGGIVTDGIINGNGGIWAIPTTNFFTVTIPNNAIASNIDFIVAKKSVLSDGSDPEIVDEGYIHRDLTDTTTESFKDKDGNDRIGNMTTMQTDLEVGIGYKEEEADTRFGFKNVDTVTGGKADETCEINSPNCLQRKFDINMAGKTELDIECGINDTCISVNGPLETEAYLIKPSGTSVFDDVRIGKLEGVRLSELIPPMVLLEIHRGKVDGNDIYMSADNNCPTGYIPIATVVPVEWTVSDKTITTSNAAWPFHGMNFKVNIDTVSKTSAGFWGSGYNCADIGLTTNNILAHYIDVHDNNKIKMRAYMGNVLEPVGGNRPIDESATFTVTATTDQTFVDSTVMPPPNCSAGKLEISLNNIDRCGISNLSTAFACNKELMEIGKRDFNNGQSADLIRWELYHPPEYMSESLQTDDLFGSVTPISDFTTVTLPDKTTASIRQTKQWKLEAANPDVKFDVYIYCKYIIQAFE